MLTSASDPDTSAANLVRRLIAGDLAALDAVMNAADADDVRDPQLLVAATVVSGEPSYLRRAATFARSSQDRQLVTLAATHLAAEHARFDVLVREHLAEFPDHLFAAWLAAEHAAQRTKFPSTPVPQTTNHPRHRSER